MFNLDVAILTAGDAYSIVMGHDEISILPTPQVEVADTVGAGDSFFRGVPCLLAARIRNPCRSSSCR